MSTAKNTISHFHSLESRLIEFGFNCHHPASNAGMSVPLLSVALACLMALFRSDDLSKRVSQVELTNLLRDAGKALLDPRLAASGSHATRLDEAISTQMVRAINKVSHLNWSSTLETTTINVLHFSDLAGRPSSDWCHTAYLNTSLDEIATEAFFGWLQW